MIIQNNSDYINKLINISQSDYITKLNNSDYINKLINISQSDYITIQNKNSENKILFINNKFLLIKSCLQIKKSY